MWYYLKLSESYQHCIIANSDFLRDKCSSNYSFIILQFKPTVNVRSVAQAFSAVW